MKTITIIGAGLSGTLLAMNLLKQAEEPILINLIDRCSEKDMGPAYSCDEVCLLLNVPACRMGALSKDPGHFLKWARKKGIHAGEYDFLPRKLYREYLQELLQQAVHQSKRATLKRIRGEVTDILMNEGNLVVTVDGNDVTSDKVVLAPGNFLPRNLPIANSSFYDSKSYFQNPWSNEIFSSISSKDTIFLIGTGQTSVDLLMRLRERQHSGKIIAMSRHGIWPLQHTTFPSYPSFYAEIIKLKTITDILRTVKKHFKEATKKGMDENAVFDSMRPYAQELWLNLPIVEKEKFLRHLFRWFEIIRSRIPQQSMAIVNRMRASGQLVTLKGRIRNINSKDGRVEIQYLPFGETKEKTEIAALVINCIGPELDYTQVDDILIQNLLRKGFIQPHRLKLGINTLTNCAIIDQNGQAGNLIFTIGSPMRGVLWETIAVPEIRSQAEQLVNLLLKDQIE